MVVHARVCEHQRITKWSFKLKIISDWSTEKQNMNENSKEEIEERFKEIQSCQSCMDANTFRFVYACFCFEFVFVFEISVKRSVEQKIETFLTCFTWKSNKKLTQEKQRPRTKRIKYKIENVVFAFAFEKGLSGSDWCLRHTHSTYEIFIAFTSISVLNESNESKMFDGICQLRLFFISSSCRLSCLFSRHKTVKKCVSECHRSVSCHQSSERRS